MSSISRPPTPDSPSSLRNATAAIDDLTAALSKFSRVPSPEPTEALTCCCGKEDCEHRESWAALKSKLEERLVLSAEVGQALLERHEAYVRKHETDRSPSADILKRPGEGTLKRTEEQVDARVAELVRENAVLEKRLSQALMNNEIVDHTYDSTLEELNNAKAKISQLSAQNARLVGVDARLARTLQERDDMQQERDSAVHRAKMAESRVTSLKERCSKYQAQVNRLREDLESQRTHRQEMSAEVLADARTRLQQLQQLQVGHSAAADDSEVTKVLESLVADNEALKRDNAELQNLLGEAREDLRVLQEEVDEHRAETSYSRHRATESIGSSVFNDQHSPLSPTFHIGTAPAASVMHSMFGRRPAAPSSSSRRAISTEREPRLAFEPLTPETNRRPLSPTDSVVASGMKWTSFKPRPRYTPSHASLDPDTYGEEGDEPSPLDMHKPPKSLLLLTRHRAVQTDATDASPGFLGPSPVPRSLGSEHFTSHDGHSESSSQGDNSTTVLGVLVERIGLLLNRMMQADALTLTTRLKRQHLVGADVSHLSRTTVNTILNESNALRAQFKSFLDDDKITTTCTRRDLRSLFKLFKDMLVELGQLRVTLNDVILDPTIAGKVSDMALHPSKSGTGNESGPGGSASTSGWMAPLTKFLGLPNSSGPDEAATRALSPPARPIGRATPRPPPRIIPKREPALSASAMTVNVEFSGAGVGRAVTSNMPGMTPRTSEMSMLTASASSGSGNASLPSASDTSRNVMDIFAGAPRVSEQSDNWIVVPKPQRLGGKRYDLVGGATIGRSAARSASVANFRGAPNARVQGRPDSISQLVNAVIDAPTSPAMQEHANIDGDMSEERDVVPDTLLQRTLRPRGLSDSSIHTTFTNHGADEPTTQEPRNEQSTRADTQSVLQALSRRVQSFRFVSSSFAPRPTSVVGRVSDATVERGSAVRASASDSSVHQAQPESAPSATISIPKPPSRAASPNTGLLQTLNFSSWAAAALPPDDLADDVDNSHATAEFYVGTSREEPLGRGWGRTREI